MVMKLTSHIINWRKTLLVNHRLPINLKRCHQKYLWPMATWLPAAFDSCIIYLTVSEKQSVRACAARALKLIKSAAWNGAAMMIAPHVGGRTQNEQMERERGACEWEREWCAVCACVGINKEALSRGPFRQPTITTFASNARVRVSKFIETRPGHKRLRVAQKLFTLWIFIQVKANLLALTIPMDFWCSHSTKPDAEKNDYYLTACWKVLP
jgi:hypothetical protein